MVSTLVGWKGAGLAGALVATAAMCAPSCFLTYWVAKAWDRFREAPWRRALAGGLAPVTVGLVGATFWLLVQAADRDVALGLVTAATVAVAYFTRLNPLFCLAAAAGLGVVGVLLTPPVFGALYRWRRWGRRLGFRRRGHIAAQGLQDAPCLLLHLLGHAVEDLED